MSEIENGVENIVWNSKIVRKILIHLNKKRIDYSANVSRKINSNFSEVSKKCRMLIERGLLESVENKARKRKNKYYRLTDKGKRIVGLLFEIDEELK